MYDRITDPTPAEIAKACKDIQATWDLKTEQRRRGIDPDSPRVGSLIVMPHQTRVLRKPLSQGGGDYGR